MKRSELSKWLRVITVVGAALLAVVCIFFIPSVGKRVAFYNPEFAYLYWPCLVTVWLSALAVLYACFLLWEMAGAIGREQTFSEENARRLKIISRLALGDVLLYAVLTVFLLIVGAMHPGILLFFIGILFIGIAIAVIAAMLSYMVEKGTAMQQENDLTI